MSYSGENKTIENKYVLSSLLFFLTAFFHENLVSKFQFFFKETKPRRIKNKFFTIPPPLTFLITLLLKNKPPEGFTLISCKKKKQKHSNETYMFQVGWHFRTIVRWYYSIGMEQVLDEMCAGYPRRCNTDGHPNTAVYLENFGSVEVSRM